MKTISKIKIRNFKRFKSLDVSFNKDINILIGDNESGKSTILQAIDFVASGSRYKVEQEGLERLFNIDCISEFQANRSYENLPILRIELSVHLFRDGVIGIHIWYNPKFDILRRMIVWFKDEKLTRFIHSHSLFPFIVNCVTITQ